jgi:hypothetical protein
MLNRIIPKSLLLPESQPQSLPPPPPPPPPPPLVNKPKKKRSFFKAFLTDIVQSVINDELRTKK